MSAFLLRNSTLLFLFLSVMGASLSAQIEEPILPGGGGGNPPPPWAITSPAGNLEIAGTTNNISTGGTWPLNDPGYTHKFVRFQVGPLTHPQTGQQFTADLYSMHDDVFGNWNDSLPWPPGVAEANWPNGTQVTVSIGQVKYTRMEILDLRTGLTYIHMNPTYDVKKTKSFIIVNP